MTKQRYAAGLAITVLLSGVLLSCDNDSKPRDKAGDRSGMTGADLVNLTGMPIVKEPITLHIFAGKSPTSHPDWNQVRIWQEYEKMTQIHTQFQMVPFDQLSSRRNLVLADGDYPDAFMTSRLSSADLLRYGQQGVFIRLNDLIDEYAPNFKRLLEKYPEIRKGLTMADGNIYSFPSFYDPDFMSMLIGYPLWVKADWLDKLGMEPPETTEEFYQYLKAVKETDLNGNGKADEIPYGSVGTSALLNHLKGAWGLGNRGMGHSRVDMDPETNELRFIPADPRYKELLQYVHKLYAEGLLEKDIFTVKSSALYANGTRGVYGSLLVPSPFTLMNQTGYVGLPALEGPHGDRLYSHVKTPLIHVGAFVITDRNPYPEATVRWIDYFFGDEGSKMFFMGIEGESYVETPDGEVVYTDSILNNKSGRTFEQELSKYVVWLGGSYPGFVTKKYFKGSESLPESIEAAERVRPYVVKEIWPPFTYTQEETERMSILSADIHPYVDEMVARFINGSVSFNEWDSYVSTLKQMGLDEYMRIYRSGYERYMQSSK
ncbi:Lipoprotein lplA [Chlamydia abortus]|nr:Lipoprotein lplA [Chlamydia abortus]